MIAHERFWKGGVGRVAVIWATSKDNGAVPLDIERPVDLAVLTSPPEPADRRLGQSIFLWAYCVV